ncbi:MAG: o-succinylbenzoate synthase [Dehalococcoidia bacterium]|nr:o-succinylbenzoate synthase [Dehalococcoidia bacterium]
MARVRRVAWRPFRIPFRQEFRAAHGLLEAREGFVVVIEGDDGVAGLGDACPLTAFTGETLEDAERALTSWLAEVAGVPLRELAPAAPSVTNAIETAYLDFHARDARRMFARYLSRGAEAPGPGSGIVPVNAVLPIGPPPEVAAAAHALVDEGFRTLKLKVGADQLDDRTRVAAVRAAVGPDIRLRLDANGAWDEGQAIARLSWFAHAAIDLCEQPVPPGPGDGAAMARIQEATGVRIAADESMAGPDAAELVRPGGAVVLKPAVLGVAATHSLLRAAAKAGCDGIVTTTFDTGIGTALAMHLAALIPEPRPACGLDTLRYLEGDIVTGVPAVAEGHVIVPNGPGLGVELDHEALDHFATGPWREALL